MSRRAVLMVLAWLLAAGATAVVGTAALDIVGAGILGPDEQSLSAQDVERRLTEAGSGTPSTTAPPSPASTPGTPAPRGLATAGGSIVAQCDGGAVTVKSWSPAQGFSTDDVTRGPAASASITFKNDETEYEVTVTCRDGQPHAESVADDRGGRGRGGRGKGGG